ncbi:hypothetical protein X777_08885, partial [Ooceraea biroi]
RVTLTTYVKVKVIGGASPNQYCNQDKYGAQGSAAAVSRPCIVFVLERAASVCFRKALRSGQAFPQSVLDDLPYTNVLVQELKEILKSKGLSVKGGKTELINRLLQSDPDGEWLLANDQEPTHIMATTENDGLDDVMSAAEAGPYDKREEVRAMDHRREIELYRREKELAEKELALARRELEFLRVSQRDEGIRVDRAAMATGSDSPATNNVTGVSATTTPAKVNVKMVADLLSEFNGQAEKFETWERQVRFLQTAYDLDDNLTKILIGTRLKGRALDWFHSKADYIEMTADELLVGLRGMFYHRPNHIILRRRFEERVWKEGETFHDYVHEKTIMANRIAVRDVEILGYIIDGIPDLNLRDLARVQGFTTREELLQAFQEIRLEDRRHPASSAASKGKDDGATARRKGIAINDIPTRAIIDTGSDITIMRADEFIKIGSPDLVRKPISFCGISKGQNTTVGEFRAKLTVDGNSYAIDVHVVSDELSKHGFLIGKDFLDTVELNVKCGVAMINPVSEDDGAPAEIYQIMIDNESEVSPVDLSHVQNDKHVRKIRELIDNYKPLQARDVGVRMKLVLPDDEPVNLRPQRLAAAEKDEVNAQLDEWLKAGMLSKQIKTLTLTYVVKVNVLSDLQKVLAVARCLLKS